MPHIILASQSPRRKELLTKMGISFDAIPSSFEEHLDEKRNPEEVAKELALGKALDVAKTYPAAYVIGSDTIVALDDRQMEKPVNLEDARSMLQALAGRESSVSTGLAIVNIEKGIERIDVSTTKVFFKPDTPEVMSSREAYLASDDWQDKAGGYGIQSGAMPLIDHIEGDYDTVVGLPTEMLVQWLTELEIDKQSLK